MLANNYAMCIALQIFYLAVCLGYLSSTYRPNIPGSSKEIPGSFQEIIQDKEKKEFFLTLKIV